MAGTNTNTPSPSQAITGVNGVVLVRLAVAPVPANWTVVKNSDWAITPKCEIKSAPNTVDGILRVGSLNDYDFTFKGHTDPNDPVEEDLMPGAVFDFQAYRKGAIVTSGQGGQTTVTGAFWAGRAIMSDLKFTTGVTDTEDWEVTAMKQSGRLTLPDGTTQW